MKREIRLMALGIAIAVNGGALMAVNAATGEFVWRVPLGVNDNMPEGKKNVGSPGYGGPMVTAGGLVFIGATRDKRFRAGKQIEKPLVEGVPEIGVLIPMRGEAGEVVAPVHRHAGGRV